jgi:transmembrane sensor
VIDTIEEQAARYILRREEGNWSDEAEQEFEAWLQQSPRHKVAYWRLEHGWAEVDRIASLDLPVTPLYRATTFLRSIQIRTVVAMAASILFLMVAGMGVFQHYSTLHTTQFATAIGQRKQIRLPDGSRIELNTDSVIRVAFPNNRRVAFLDRGEAYFEIAHDPTRPFYVHSGDRQIEVLGTKFGVRRDPDKIVTSVVEGKVQFGRVVNGDVQDTLILTHGNMVIAKGNQSLAIYDATDNVSNALGWTRGLLVFNRTTLGAAADEFNRYNRRKLIFSDRDIAATEIGGTFRPENVDAFARLMAEAYGLKVEKGSSWIRLSKLMPSPKQS